MRACSVQIPPTSRRFGKLVIAGRFARVSGLAPRSRSIQSLLTNSPFASQSSSTIFIFQWPDTIAGRYSSNRYQGQVWGDEDGNQEDPFGNEAMECLEGHARDDRETAVLVADSAQSNRTQGRVR